MTKTNAQVGSDASDEALRQRVGDLVAQFPPNSTDQVTFRGAQFDAGLAWIHHPVGRGGLGGDRRQQAVVDDALRQAGVRYHNLAVNPMGIALGAPTLLAHGTDAQLERYLRPLFTGEEIWCQLFSEPSSGSDLASLATRATLDGDEWVVNGQKVWTTLAHVAAVGMLIARTDPGVVKHKGLTYMLVDMTASGVEVQPLYQMTGEAEFNEVFLTDVRVPSDQVVGEVGGGWGVALTTLSNERAAIGSSDSSRSSTPKGRRGSIGRLLDTWESTRDILSPHQRAVARDRVTDLWIRSEVRRLMLARARGGGPETATGKLSAAELRKAIFEACVDLEGSAGTLHSNGYPMARIDEIAVDPTNTGQFLRSRAATIEGGTSEIVRNILGERILGLPPEPRTDVGMPWNESPR